MVALYERGQTWTEGRSRARNQSSAPGPRTFDPMRPSHIRPGTTDRRGCTSTGWSTARSSHRCEPYTFRSAPATRASIFRASCLRASKRPAAVARIEGPHEHSFNVVAVGAPCAFSHDVYVTNHPDAPEKTLDHDPPARSHRIVQHRAIIPLCSTSLAFLSRGSQVRVRASAIVEP